MDGNNAEQPDTLEQTLGGWEPRLAEAERQVNGLLRGVRRVQRAAREGEVAALPALTAALRDATARAAEAIDRAATPPGYDLAASFANGSFLAELSEAAAGAGVTLVIRDGVVSCYPVALRLDAARQGVRVGRKLDRRVRPAFLVAQLRRLQQLPNRFNARAFLDRTFKAYALLARAADARWKPTAPVAGPAVTLTEIYEALTLLPAAAADYRLEEFSADLLRLDRQPDTRTHAGHRFEFAGSTGLKGGKRLTVFDERGASHDYFAIRFVLESPDGRAEHAAAGGS